MTCDEPYHVAYGKRLVSALRAQGFGFFSPEQIERNFDWRPGGPPVHPPLGNWLLGWIHHAFDQEPDNPLSVSITAARFAPAMAFGLLIFLVGRATAGIDGPLAGIFASAATLLLPRLFGHAHLAALDMFTALFFTAAAVAVVWGRCPRRTMVALCGRWRRFGIGHAGPAPRCASGAAGGHLAGMASATAGNRAFGDLASRRGNHAAGRVALVMDRSGQSFAAIPGDRHGPASASCFFRGPSLGRSRSAALLRHCDLFSDAPSRDAGVGAVGDLGTHSARLGRSTRVYCSTRVY